MKPSLAYFLTNTFLSKNEAMLDPFCGVGTIPFEAALNGIKSYGFDISPAALAIAKGKVENVSIEECEKIINTLEQLISQSNPLDFDIDLDLAQTTGYNGKIVDFYHQDTLGKLITRRYFIQNPPLTASQSLVFACILHILHGNRPYALIRNSHPITPFKPSRRFVYRSLIKSLKDKVYRSLQIPKSTEFVEGKIYAQDATAWWPQDVINLDAIITSPPFFDSTRFHMGNWMRLWYCGWKKGFQ